MVQTIKSEFTDYILDRNTASKLLKVSVRTLDRYLRDNKLSCSKDDGRIWLSKAEIGDFKHLREERQARRILDRTYSDLSVESGSDNGDFVAGRLSSHVHTGETGAVESVYKALYQEAKNQLEDQQKRLEGANYRVGQLEAELKNTVPMREFQQKEVHYLESSEDMKQRMEKVVEKLKETQRQYQIEKYNKFIYLLILLGVLALQPLWLAISSA